MMKPQRIPFTLIFATGIAFGLAIPASATTIIFDGFDGLSNGTTIIGTTPDTTLTGGNYLDPNSQGSAIATTSFGNAQPSVQFNEQGAAALDLDSSGSYTKPTNFSVTADIRVGNTSGAASDMRGMYLGFYSALGNGFSNNSYTGLILDSTGAVSLAQDTATGGFQGAPDVLATVAFSGGSFSATTFSQLSFEVDTTTGAISNISLAGSTADYSSLEGGSLFTDSATRYLGIAASSSVANTSGQMDNVSLVAIPEPGSLALLGLGGLLIASRRRRA